ncbi:ATP-binding protein [Pleomorphomonas sp. NRK KF1]|uniref:ATP-binding protein n=1 Tax=Pleomorphomonas sp. NRK KF1 TaxID=2943000 RepID=UPI0020433BDE|nr:ATP-binding protein [Pleomorphomonas sp. NRK KF1]MCM5552894.1 ATP-binding protein [Pleomorphomonas sp. NRK KF1]
MKELVVLSGKGGTGKTSLTACFASLAQPVVLADCDVDAANLHLVLAPKAERRETFRAGREAHVETTACCGCGRCAAACRFDSMSMGGPHGTATVDPLGCEGCGVCAFICPTGAIGFNDRVAGSVMVSRTRCGAMAHARLTPGSDNSGKLVSWVRQQARRLAEEENCQLVLIDGPPGLACPTMAALTGCSHALIVIEPTMSGLHDLDRILALTKHFEVPTSVCVNKWDIDAEKSVAVERRVRTVGGHFAGRVRYDRGVTQAQMHARTAVEDDTASAADIRSVWRQVAGQIAMAETGY